MLLLRGATRPERESRSCMTFQYMLLLRGATLVFRVDNSPLCVSIHAPLARSNLHTKAHSRGSFSFNTCSSCEEQLQGLYPVPLSPVSIHAPLARSNVWTAQLQQRHAVSIHAPLARSNTTGDVISALVDVSIHAPLARSNAMRIHQAFSQTLFQYMLLLRGAT